MWLDAIAYAVDCACAVVIGDAVMRAHYIPLAWREFGLLQWLMFTPIAWVLIAVHPWGLFVAAPLALWLWLLGYAGG